MHVGDFDYCYVAVLIGGNIFRSYLIERDAKREKQLLDAEIAFWALVQSDRPPPIQSEADAKHRWKVALEGTAVEVDAATKMKVVTLGQVSERRKTAEKEEKRLKDELVPLFLDKEALSFEGERIASFTCYPRNDFDIKAFREKHAKLEAKFTRSLPTKRLNVLI
jgi:predicted phage-related endonuclease